MLYWLLYEYIFRHFNVGPFRIFRYLTFRTAFASLTALFMALIIGPSVIRRLREFQIGQYIREEGPRSHQKKAGTPTMGGSADCGLHRAAHAALVRPVEQVCLAGGASPRWRSAPLALPTTT